MVGLLLSAIVVEVDDMVISMVDVLIISKVGAYYMISLMMEKEVVEDAIIVWAALLLV